MVKIMSINLASFCGGGGNCPNRRSLFWISLNYTYRLMSGGGKIGNVIIMQATCNALGGYLVQIESPAEQEFVWNIKKSSKNSPLSSQFRQNVLHIFL